MKAVRFAIARGNMSVHYDAMTSARLILCEHTTCWAPALRQAVEQQPIRLVETRTWAECLERLAESSWSVVALQLVHQRADRVLAVLEDIDRRFPHAVTLVLAVRSMGSYGWLMREAGAVYFTSSPRRLDIVAQLVGRYLDRVPEQTNNLLDGVQTRMPWGE